MLISNYIMHLIDLNKRMKRAFLGTIFLLIYSGFSLASGVLPETSVLIINEEKKGGSINVKNTEKFPVLLYTKVTDLSDDKSPRLIATLPVSRLEPGQTQRVRFILDSSAKLDREHIKRVFFEGVAEQSSDSSQVSVTVRQDLPVIIIPKGMLSRKDMWNDLKWEVVGKDLKISNSGRQVVRLSPQLHFFPSKSEVPLKKSYILPNETITIEIPKDLILKNQRYVEFSPVTRYGFEAGVQRVELSGNKSLQ